MSYSLQVFVSSACYELRDLRAAVQSWLKNLGLTPILSDEGGFPHEEGLPPYAACLRVLETCPLVVGVIDRQYGHPFEDWGPYEQYRGLSPTHAELRHALDSGKRLLLFVHSDIWAFYEVWRENAGAFKTSAPYGLEEATLRMLHEFKTRSPAPWIERFANVTVLLESLNREFVNQLYVHLREREKQTADTAGYFLDKIIETAPEVREKITVGLNPALVADREALRSRLSEIEEELEKTRGKTEERIFDLEKEKSEVHGRLSTVSGQLDQARMLLARSVMKDISWLDFIRRTMVPPQPGRVPFHNSVEVALRGYHAAAGGQNIVPLLREVTWSLVPYNENGLHRGYNAAIIFKGDNFVPGVVYTWRRCGESDSRAGNDDYFWRLPNIYFGSYLEVSSGDNEPEAALSWRNYEFLVKNPEGRTSEWVPFTYPFDDASLEKIRTDSFRVGTNLLEAGKPAEAVEPLRKAYVFSDRMLGTQAQEALSKKAMWERALNEAALSKLRFRVGDQLSVVAGPHAGASGVVKNLLPRHLHAYVISSTHGEEFQASDAQVESAGGL
jgi:hypothetical protein